MQLMFHTGAHLTDEDRLIKCLLANTETLQKYHVAVPRPALYRELFRDTFAALESSVPLPNARASLLDAIQDNVVEDRVLLSHAHFFGTQWSAIRDGQLYPLAASRMALLCDIFDGEQIEMFMSFRNLASFIPKVLAWLPERGRNVILKETDLSTLRWSQVVRQVRELAPQVKLTVWCNEDTPIVWGRILRAMAALPETVPVRGEIALLYEILSKEGLHLLRQKLSRTPDLSQAQRGELIMSYLDKYALEDRIEEELEFPGWTQEVVDAFSEIYDADMAVVRDIPGVNFITP